MDDVELLCNPKSVIIITCSYLYILLGDRKTKKKEIVFLFLYFRYKAKIAKVSTGTNTSKEDKMHSYRADKGAYHIDY